MLKFLKGVVAGSGSGGLKELPYNIGEPYSSAWGSWIHYRGTSKDDGSSVSIFSLSGSNAQDGHLMAARNGVKRLRTVRHPNVLSFLHSAEVEVVEGSIVRPTIYIVTEPVMPLSEKIKELGLEGTQRDEYYAWGLHQIAKAVSFLNNDCKLVHGNVCLESVVVTPTLDWKLHAFDVLSEFDGHNEAATGPMLQFEWLVGAQYKPIELLKNDWATIRKSPPWAMDSWGMGCLIFELFSATKLARTEELRNIGCVPKTLLPDYQRLLSSTPARRLNTAKLIENSDYFHNKLVETIQFMEVLNLKDSVEKDSFFRKLPNLAEQLPRQIVLKKLLPMLASSLEFGSAAAPALNSLLKLGSWLSTDEFNSKVLPTIVKLFASSDRAIRVGLLQHIDQYGASLSAQIVDEQVYVHVATGFSDTSAFLRELTLKAMLILIPKLSQRTITGSLLKYLSKLQVDEEPAIRTNTTILLGNIASYLNEGTRRRVLINAFTVRALRDGFAPARAAGLMALSATSSYYDPAEIATRILPNVVVLTIDPDSDVRSKAFEAIDLFLQSMKQHHEKGDAATGSGALTNVGSASLLGWAMSSLTLKGKGSEHVLAPSSNSVVVSAHQGTTSSNNSGLYVSDTSATHLSSAVDHIDHPPPSPTSTDGWGEIDENGVQEEESDKDGWDDIEVMEEKKTPASLATIHAAQQRPIVQTKLSGANSLPSRHQSRVSKDVTKVSDDEDPWAAIAAPQPTTKVKSLSVASTSSHDDNDPWAAIAAPPPSTTVKPLSATTTARIRSSSENSNRPNSANIHPSGSGRGRGSKTAPMKLGAQRLSRNSEL